MKLKWILIGLLVLVTAVATGVLIALAILPDPSSMVVRSHVEQVEVDLNAEAESEQMIESELKIASVVKLLEVKLGALDIEHVHQKIYSEVLTQSKSSNNWKRTELTVVIEPIVINGIDDWIEGSITSIASEQKFDLTTMMIRDLRERFIHPDWYAFLTLYEIAFLRSEGIIITNDD